MLCGAWIARRGNAGGPSRRTDAVRPLRAHHGGRDVWPAEDLAELIGRDLAPVQRPGLEIPQRRFAAGRLVDGQQPGRRMRFEAGEKRVVRRTVKQAEHLEVGKLGEQPLGPAQGRGAARTIRRSAARHWKPGMDGRRGPWAVSYTHLRAHETRHDLVCRLLLEKKKRTKKRGTSSQ